MGCFGNDFAQIRRSRIDFEASGFQAGTFQQIIYQRLQACEQLCDFASAGFAA